MHHEKRHGFVDAVWSHFSTVNRNTAHFYREAIGLLAKSDATFRCVVMDTRDRDPFGGQRESWKVHAQLVISALSTAVFRNEIAGVVIDTITLPAGTNYEGYVRTAVNRQLGTPSVATVCRMDSRACWGLQLADLLTGAVAHQYRQGVDATAKPGSPKGQLAATVAERFNLESLCQADSPRFKVRPLVGNRQRSKVTDLGSRRSA